MKFSLNWIRDFVELDAGIEPSKLVEKVTLSVCEIEGYEETGKHLSSILVAEILEKNPHPDANKLSLVRINYGTGEKVVVCGAQNFQVGDKVPYAGLGTVLPGDFKIKKAKIRGVVSEGMLCAEDELGLSDDHEGLMILPMNTEVGKTLAEIFPDQVDLILEVDNKSITHRPDLWGHYGFAREIAALYHLPLKEYDRDLSQLKGEGAGLVEVEVLAKDLVPRFSGISVSNIRIMPSPLWIQQRLSRVDLRPINNLVDITNYVMMELGQPMHAFDAEQIPGNKLTVKLADEGSKVMTLYKKEAVLTSQDLTICDANGPSVVGGVIGGLNSGVVDETTSIFFEAANWNPVAIRKTSTRLGIRTDACQRYEKSLDPEMTAYAILHAVHLLKLTNPDFQIRGELVDIWGDYKRDTIQVELDLDFVTKRLGKKLEDEEIVQILTRLEFQVAQDGRKLAVDVPSFRSTKDVSIPEDLVEEVGRMHGYNNIEPVPPLFPIERPAFNQQRLFDRLGKSVLSQSGYFEVYTYPLTCDETESFLENRPEVMRLINPVAENLNQMRTSLFPHFLEAVKENQKDVLNFSVFEISRVYEKQGEGASLERNHLILGHSCEKGGIGKAFYQLKSDLKNLFAHLGINQLTWKTLEHREKYQHRHIAAEIYAGDQKLGTQFSLDPQFRDQWGIRGDVCFAIFDFDQMYELDKKEIKFQPISKFPPVYFDISLMVPVRTYFQEIQDLILSFSKRVKKVDFADLYYPKDTPDLKSMTISMRFQAGDKTLETEEVRTLQDKVVSGLAKKGFHLRDL